MNLAHYFPALSAYLHAKDVPNARELALYARARWHLARLQYIPGLRMVAVCNSLAYYGTHEDSDIDLFIVTDPRRLWIVRIIFTAYFGMLGIRKDHHTHRGRFCLSFFVTTRALDLSRIAITDDIYLAYWIYTLRPMLDRDDTYVRFLRENTWVDIESERIEENKKYVVSTRHCECNEAISPFLNKLLYRTSREWRILSNLLDILDRFLSRILLPRALAKKQALADPWGTILSDDMLKFHDEDRRKKVREGVIH